MGNTWETKRSISGVERGSRWCWGSDNKGPFRRTAVRNGIKDSVRGIVTSLGKVGEN